MVAIKGMPRILKATCHTGGDGWKNTDVQGEVVYCWDFEYPKPYKPGQFLRVGFTNWTVSTDHFSLEPVDESEYMDIINRLIEDMRNQRNDANYALNALKNNLAKMSNVEESHAPSKGSSAEDMIRKMIS